MTERFNANIGAKIKDFQRKMKQVDKQVKATAMGVEKEVKADIKDFMTKSKIVELEAKDIAKGVTKTLDLDIKKFQAQAAKTNSELNVLMRKQTKEIDLEIKDFVKKASTANVLSKKLEVPISKPLDADITKFMAAVKKVQKEELDMKVTTTKPIDADTRKLMKKYQAVNVMTERLTREAIKPIDVNTMQFRRQMAEVEARVKLFTAKSVKMVEIQGDTSPLRRAIRRARAMLRKIPDPFAALGQKIELFQTRMDNLASSIRTFSTIFTNMFVGSLVAAIPALVPMIAALTGAIAGLGNMLGVISGSAFALVSAFGFAGGAAVAFAMVAVPSIKAIFDETANLNAEQQKAKSAFDDMKSTYQGIVKELEKPVLEAFTKAMNIANKMMQMARPLFDGAATAVNNLLTSFDKSLNTAPVQAFFDYINKMGGPLLETLGKGIGYMIQGLTSMMTAFGPLAETTAGGFMEMNKRFSEWAAGLSQSKKFQAFIDYVNENMPKIRAIFRDMIAGIVYLFAAFAPMSKGFIDGFADMMARFKEWAKALGDNQQFQKFIDYIQTSGPQVIEFIGQLTKFLVNLGIGMSDLGGKILGVIDGFLRWSNEMMKNNPIIGKMVGYLIVAIGVFMALTPVILSVITFFGGFGGVLKKIPSLLKKIGPKLKSMGTWFKNLGPNILRLGKTAIPTLLKGLGKIPGPVGIIITIVTLLASGFISLYKNSETFRKAVQKGMARLGIIFDTFKEVASNSFDTFKSLLKDGAEFFKAIVNGEWSKAGEILKNSFKKLWNTMKENAVTGLNGLMKAFGTDLINWLKGLPSTIKQNVSTWAEALVTWIPIAKRKAVEKLAEWAKALSTWFSEQKIELAKKLIQWWSAIGQWFDEVPSKIKTKLATWKTTFSTWFDEQKTTLTEKLGQWWTTMGEWFDSIPSKITEKLGQWGTSIGTWFLEKKSQFTEWLAGWGTTITDWFSTMPEKILIALESWSNAMKQWTSDQNAKNKEYFGGWWTTISEWFDSIPTKITEKLIGWKDALSLWFDEQKENIGTKLENWWTKMSEWFSNVPSRITGALTGWWTSMSSWFDTSKENIGTKLENWWDKIRTWFAEIPSRISKALEDWWQAIKNWFTSVPDKPEIKDMGKEMIDKVSEGNSEKKQDFIDRLGKIIVDVALAALAFAAVALLAAGREIIKRIVSGVEEKRTELKQKFDALMVDATTAVADGYEGMKSAGSDLIAGVISGITGKVGDAYEAVKSFGSNLLERFKTSIGVASPSKEMAAIAKWIPPGVAKGIKSTSKKATDAAKQLAFKVNESMKNLEVRYDTGKISAKSYIDGLKNIRKNNKLTGDQSRKIQREIYATEQKTSKARIKLSKDEAKAKDALNKKVLTANYSYLSKFKAINKKLTDDVRKVRDEYNNALKDRQNELYNQTGLFDAVDNTEQFSGKTLLNNLKKQLSQANKLQGLLRRMSERAPKALIEELRNMGPESLGEIQGLAGLSNKDFAEYVKLWKQKHAQAKAQATKELSGLKGETEQKVREMRAAANKELGLLRNDYLVKLRQIAKDVSMSKSLRNSGAALGRDSVRGIISGMQNMRGELKGEANKVANTIVKTIKSQLKIKSPSRVLRDKIGQFIPAGLAEGIKNAAQLPVKALQMVAQSMSSSIVMDELRTSMIVDPTVSRADMAAIRQTFDAEISDFELPETQVHVHNEIVGDKIETTVTKRQIQKSRMRDGFRGK